MDDIFDRVDSAELELNDERDYLAELVGEGKKFKEVSELAKGKYHADVTIEVLKKKIDDLTKELSTRTSLDSFKTELEKMRTGSVPTPEVIQPDTSKAMLDPNDLEARLDQLLAQREARKTAETNNEKVIRVLNEHFGDQAKLAINKKAQELGIAPQELKEIAQRSPKALFDLLGVAETRPLGQTPVVPQSTVQTRQNTNTGVRGQSYYDKLKATDPKRYFSNEVTNQMLKDAMVLGDAFKSS